MFTSQEQAVIDEALSILESKARYSSAITSPAAGSALCRTKIGHLDHEVFAVAFLDNRHRLISFDVMFRGTIDATSVYPREVAKAALLHNAAAVILAHNHPSGLTDPSSADERITRRLVDALDLLEIRVLDHIIVSVSGSTSLANRGMI